MIFKWNNLHEKYVYKHCFKNCLIVIQGFFLTNLFPYPPKVFSFFPYLVWPVTSAACFASVSLVDLVVFLFSESKMSSSESEAEAVENESSDNESNDNEPQENTFLPMI